MRTLKKTLCLVLAVVLCFGLVGTAFAGNLDKYSDAKDIDANYVEAVDVLTGLGIVEGDAGAIDANGTFTRAALAKIAAYLTLGPSAKNLAGTTATFKDVPTNHWAQPFVAYCASMNLIEGDGDGNFRPDAAISGYEMAVLMLRAVGYGAKKEFSGADWTLNASKGALQNGILNKALIADGANSGAALQRDQAMQMAFNTLTKVDTVKFSALISDYVKNTASSGAIGTTTDPVRLMVNFSLVKNTDRDNGLGLLGHIWAKGVLKADKSNAVSDWYQDDEVLETLVGPMTAKQILAKYESTAFATPTAVPQYYNGVLVGTISYANLVTAATDNDPSNDLIIPAGASVYVVDGDGDGYVTKVCSVEEYIAVVTTANATAKTYAAIGKFGTLTDIKNTKGYVKGDTLLVTPNLPVTAFKTNAKVDKSFTGTVTDAGSDTSYIKVDGKSYYISNNVYYDSTKITLSAAGLVGGTFDFYLDSTGAVCYIANPVAAAALQYCYVTESKGGQGSAILGQAAYARAAMVKTDGTASYVNIYSYTKNGVLTVVNANGQEAAAADNVIPAGYYSYVEKSDGSFQFTTPVSTKAVGLDNNKTVAVANKNPMVTIAGSSMLVTNATTLNVANKGSVTTTTGYAAWSTKTYETAMGVGDTTKTFILYTLGTAGVVTSINVFSASAAATTTYGYYFGQVGNVSSAGTAYKFYVDGEVKEYITSTAPTAGEVYVMNITSATEASINLVSTTAPTAGTAGKYVVKGVRVGAVDAGYFTAEGALTTPIVLGSACKVFDITTVGTVTAGTLVGETSTTHGVQVTYVVDQPASGTSTVAVIFITGAATTK